MAGSRNDWRDCSQPCIKNTQHIFDPLAVWSRIFSPERKPEHLQFQLPLKKLTYSSRHENQASESLLKLAPPFSEPCMELNPWIGKRLKQSSWDQQKQTTSNNQDPILSTDQCFRMRQWDNGTKKCCLGWITGSDCVSHVFPSKLHLDSCERINHYVGKSPPAKPPKTHTHTKPPNNEHLQPPKKRMYIYIYDYIYICVCVCVWGFNGHPVFFPALLQVRQHFSAKDGSPVFFFALWQWWVPSCCLQENWNISLLAGELKRKFGTKPLNPLSLNLNWGSPTVTWDASPTATGRGPASSLSEWDCHSKPICRMILGGTGIFMRKHIMDSFWDISDPAKLRWHALVPPLLFGHAWDGVTIIIIIIIRTVTNNYRNLTSAIHHDPWKKQSKH